MPFLKSRPARRCDPALRRPRAAVWCARVLLLLTLAGAAGFTAAAGTVLVLGDSLSAGYGLPAGQGWVDLLSRKMAQTHPGFKVVNASISGETTFGGVGRLPDLLRTHTPAVVVIELGANDGLRGTDIALTRDNLRRLARDSLAAGARPLLVGMRIPPNYGPAYTRQFAALFAEVARETGAATVPFLLDGIAEHRELFQDDGIHPSPAAQPRMLDNVLPHLLPMLSPSRRAAPKPPGRTRLP
ncbi:MAG: arylesterase [Betaproteobacteria bacterium]